MLRTLRTSIKIAGIASVLLFGKNQLLGKSKVFAASEKSPDRKFGDNIQGKSGKNSEKFPLVLRNVQVFVRHGARTPLRVLPYLEQATWSLEELMADPPELARFSYVVKDLKLNPLEMGLFESLSRNVVFKGGANAGQLTMTGKRQMYQLGLDLREEYVNNLKFLKSDYDKNDIYIRSTNITRTMESAVWMVSGLCDTKQSIGKVSSMTPITVFATTEEDEILYPNHSFCAALTRLTVRISQAMHEIAGLLADRDALEKALQYDLNSHSKKRVDFVDLRDEVAARAAHQMDINPVLQNWQNKIDQYAVMILVRMVAGNNPSTDIQKQLLRLACGPALYMVMTNMYGVLHNRNRFKLEVYSCHDSMMISLLLALNIFDGLWPPYAADLRFELLENPETGKFFVRIRYLGKECPLPDLDGESWDGSCIYPLEEFEEFLNALAVDQRHLKELCEEKSPYTEPLDSSGESEGSYFIAAKEQK